MTYAADVVAGCWVVDTQERSFFGEYIVMAFVPLVFLLRFLNEVSVAMPSLAATSAGSPSVPMTAMELSPPVVGGVANTPLMGSGSSGVSVVVDMVVKSGMTGTRSAIGVIGGLGVEESGCSAVECVGGGADVKDGGWPTTVLMGRGVSVESGG